MITMCPVCAGNLLADFDKEERSEPSEFERWVAEEIEAIIAFSSAWLQPLQWNPAAAMKVLGKEAGIENAAAFGRFVGTSKITCWYWFTGAARPSLPMALHVYHRFGASLASSLSGKMPATRDQTGPHQSEMHLRRVRVVRKHDWAELKRLLVAETRKPLAEAVPLAEFARRNHVYPRILRFHFRLLCLRVAHRHRLRNRREAERRQAELTARIKAAMVRLMRRGAELTPRAVAAELGHPGLFSRHNARRAYRCLLRGGETRR